MTAAAMTDTAIERFMRRVASEPERTVVRAVRVVPAEALARASAPGGLLLTEILSAAGPQDAPREFDAGDLG